VKRAAKRINKLRAIFFGFTAFTREEQEGLFLKANHKHRKYKIMTYRHYTESFKEWLQVINLSETSIERLPKQLQEFFDWSEKKQVMQLEAITRHHVDDFYNYIKHERKSMHTGKLLRPQTLNSYIRCLKLFAHYPNSITQRNKSTLIDLLYGKRELPKIDVSGANCY
jgi:site-specific recombinase XerD